MRRVYSVINIRDANLNYASYLYRYVKGWDNVNIIGQVLQVL